MSISEELVKLAEDLQDLTEGSISPWDTDEDKYNSVANSYADLYNNLDSASLLKIASDLTLLAAAKEEDGEGVKLASEYDEVFQYTPAEALLMEKYASQPYTKEELKRLSNYGIPFEDEKAGFGERVKGLAGKAGRFFKEHPKASLATLASIVGAGIGMEELARRHADKVKGKKIEIDPNRSITIYRRKKGEKLTAHPKGGFTIGLLK